MVLAVGQNAVRALAGIGADFRRLRAQVTVRELSAG